MGKSTGKVLDLPCIRGGVVAPTTQDDVSQYKQTVTPVNMDWQKEVGSGIWTPRYDGTAYFNIDTCLTQLAHTTKGTWMSWVKLDDATPALTTVPISFGDTSASERLEIAILTTGKFYAIATIAGVVQWEIWSTTASIVDGVYAHFVLAQNGVAPVIYRNGVAITLQWDVFVDTTVWFNSQSGIDNGRIGCMNYNVTGNGYFINNGNTALTKIYDYDMEIGEVQDIFQHERVLFGV